MSEPYDWTPEMIAKAVRVDAGRGGFVRDVCPRCRKTANLHGSGHWTCVCGAFNPCFGTSALHEAPDIGPSAATICEGIRLAFKE